MNQSDNAKKETFGQKVAKNNGWITWAAFAAIAIAAVITLAQHH